VHRSKSALLMSEMGQNEKPPVSGLCQLTPAAADITPQMLTPLGADIVAKVGNCPVIIFPLKVDPSDDRRSL